jgi:hypothetical protein
VYTAPEAASWSGHQEGCLIGSRVMQACESKQPFRSSKGPPSYTAIPLLGQRERERHRERERQRETDLAGDVDGVKGDAGMGVQTAVQVVQRPALVGHHAIRRAVLQQDLVRCGILSQSTGRHHHHHHHHHHHQECWASAQRSHIYVLSQLLYAAPWCG